jgi:hypothetical protein
MDKRIGALVVVGSCLLALQLPLRADVAQHSATLGKVVCRADQIDAAANDVSPTILNGHAEAVFPTFHLRADRIELTHSEATSRFFVIAHGGVILEQASQATKFRSLTFEVDAPK